MFLFAGVPLNSETPLALLLDAGFITPTNLHFVRNAGPVPKLDARTHTLTVAGNVKQAKTFTMDQIAKMPSQTLPVTLVCAGNRRKEMNMLKQTTGYIPCSI
jgi:nitrate reductase (NAD(P)H)